MAGNRYWDQAPIATMTAMPRASMQDLAMAPSFKYAQEQKALDEAYQLNNMADSLSASLGDKAVVPSKFKEDYNAFLADVDKNGINSRNIDAARRLKNIWTTEVKPIEMFASERSKYNDAYMKASMDQNNLILGKTPADVTFDEYKKNPNAFQFSTIGKDKLYTYGAKAGDEWKTGQTAKTVLDQYGRLHDQKGFSNPQEVATAYSSDKAFAGLVEDNIKKVMQANGISTDNQDAASAIRTGMMSQMVGKDDVQNAPSEWLKSQAGMGGYDPLAAIESSPGAISVNQTASRVENPYDNQDQTTAYLLSDASLTKSLDERTAAISKNKYKTYKELVSSQPKGGNKVSMELVGTSYVPIVEHVNASGDPDAGKYLEKINKTFSNTDAGGLEIMPEWGTLETARGNDEVKRYQNILKGYGKDIINNMQSFGTHKLSEPYRAAGKSKEIVDLWKDKSSKNHEVEVVGINIDATTGKPFVKVLVSADNADKTKSMAKQPVYLELPPEMTYNIINMFTAPTMLGVGRKSLGERPASISDKDWERYSQSHPYNIMSDAANRVKRYYTEIAPAYEKNRKALNLE